MSASPEESQIGIKIGVLALQGGYAEHSNILSFLSKSTAFSDYSLSVVEVRTSSQLRDPELDALIIPGGESTTMAIIAESTGCLEPLKEFVRAKGKSVWGTCAGLIMLADRATHTKQLGQSTIGGLAVTVERNAFGAQKESFTADLTPPPPPPRSSAVPHLPTESRSSEQPPFPCVFIRAPLITSLDDPSVQVLCTLFRGGQEFPVAVRQGDVLGTAFHPELTDDGRWHAYFVGIVGEAKRRGMGKEN
ncbi:hypothetical protein HDU93_000178 [Gonapodya sp. JEL0774]|nr:hypothetical protein HDU93_000178 [Gonapodya sp. JEL0774]